MKKTTRKLMLPKTILLSLTILSVISVASRNVSGENSQKESPSNIIKNIDMGESMSLYSYLPNDTHKKD